MKKIWQKIWKKLSGKSLILGGTCILAILAGGALLLLIRTVAAGLIDQTGAERWSPKGGAAQISCFFSGDATISQDQVLSFEHSLDSALVEASIVNESENPGARLWADAYSAQGTITLKSDKSSVDADAVGIGGDFFLFHPVQLVSGAYFSGNDVMKDYCIVDRDLAWQLFGSSNIAGQMITIKDIPHIIVGVVEREDGGLAGAAGLDGPMVYVSYETLSTYGQTGGISSYEIVMPNPVDSYALNYVKEHIGVQEAQMEVLENTGRYSLLSLIDVIRSFGTRSMSRKSIVYPYWENIARGWEDIFGAVLVAACILFLYALIVIVAALAAVWRHKTWNFGTIYLALKNRAEDLRERRWAAQKARSLQKQTDQKQKKKRGN